ncbi:MAG: ATP-binding protein [Nitrospirae bacterium]|nr:MAG: ATP-binding protein [Nitrospirota bacterium]
MEPWYKIATPRREVREGRSFNPDEFAIALEQVVAKTAPDDYRDPAQFFARNYWTRALREHAGMVLRRLSGETQHTAPVLTLITQFGGGKTHTLTALYHLATSGEQARAFAGVTELIQEAGLSTIPQARVGVFVGNAWDPQSHCETPWIDLARQLAGEAGVEALGPAAKTTPPGTTAIARLFQVANGPVLLLFDEVLNFLTRYREQAEAFRAFLGNLVRCTTGTTQCAAVISLPQSKPELDDWELRWQELIAKEIGRVAKHLIANDEREISEVVRRRLFEDLGSERVRKLVAKTFADWCFERRAQLPPEWTAVDTATTEARSKEFLRSRFEACYPFHPATLSVFQRKWQALPQYQQTRGTLAMLAQWIAWAYRDGFLTARREPLITLGSAPLHDPGFRSTILGQLGEPRLVAAIDADIAGDHAHAKVLDADTKGPLRDIHRRVGTAILFESSGGQTDKVAHLPELRFALGEPVVDTTSVDTAAFALEERSYFLRRVGSDGFKIGYQPTLKKVVNDRRASLDEETEIIPALRKVVEQEFRRGASIPIVAFPRESAEVPDEPRLRLIVMDPDAEWVGTGPLRAQLAEWTLHRGASPRLYPGSLVWCLKKSGRELREKIELMLAWQRVAREVSDGTLGSDFDRADRAEVQSKMAAAQAAAQDEVWASYRFAVIADQHSPDGLKSIDLGAGHSSSGETLCGRVIAALKSEALLNESIGASYLDRHWPPAFKDSGAWPLISLRQSFVNGSLTRLLDPDTTLRSKIAEFVARGDFGLASGQRPDGTYERVWFEEPLSRDEIAFEPDVFLLKASLARALRHREPSANAEAEPSPPLPVGGQETSRHSSQEHETISAPLPQGEPVTIHVTGQIPPELWNRLGTKVLPKLRSAIAPGRQGADVKVGVDFSVTVDRQMAASFTSEIRQILDDLGLTEAVQIQSR